MQQQQQQQHQQQSQQAALQLHYGVGLQELARAQPYLDTSSSSSHRSSTHRFNPSFTAPTTSASALTETHGFALPGMMMGLGQPAATTNGFNILQQSPAIGLIPQGTLDPVTLLALLQQQQLLQHHQQTQQQNDALLWQQQVQGMATDKQQASVNAQQLQQYELMQNLGLQAANFSSNNSALSGRTMTANGLPLSGGKEAVGNGTAGSARQHSTSSTTTTSSSNGNVVIGAKRFSPY